MWSRLRVTFSMWVGILTSYTYVVQAEVEGFSLRILVIHLYSFFLDE